MVLRTKVNLSCYKTLWGFTGSPEHGAVLAKQQGYDGVEGPAPSESGAREGFARALRDNQLTYIAEIATTGSYVPDRRYGVSDHLEDLRGKLETAAGLAPEFVTCLGGCDAWTFEQSIEFFCRAIDMAAEYQVPMSFETHRGRSLFNPWTTAAILKELPELQLTFDISHWWVVCEGLQPTEQSMIANMASNAFHIHARVGYDQGPQVPDPARGVYQAMLQSHLKTWRSLWQGMTNRGHHNISMTPEFGPDGYEYRSIDGTQPLVDLDKVNQFMAGILRREFKRWCSEELAGAANDL